MHTGGEKGISAISQEWLTALNLKYYGIPRVSYSKSKENIFIESI